MFLFIGEASATQFSRISFQSSIPVFGLAFACVNIGSARLDRAANTVMSCFS